jgi:hypothetical protein
MTVGQIILIAIVVFVGVPIVRRIFRPGPNASPWTANRVLRWGLGLWTIAYPVVACSPMLVTGAGSAGSATAGGLTSLLVGATLFGPWIVGVIVLGVLVLLTNPRASGSS